MDLTKCGVYRYCESEDFEILLAAYSMGHSDIGVTLNTYTHLGLEDAVDELKRVEELENARKEMEKINGEGTVSQKMFRVI